MAASRTKKKSIEPSPTANTLPPSTRRFRWLLASIVAVYLVLAGLYNAFTPAATADQHNPDENAHMLYVRSVTAGHLPVFHIGGADYEAHQPPLYYLASAPIYLAIHGQGEAAATHAVRWVSTLFGLCLIVVTALCVLTLFPDDPLLALLTALLVGWLPGNVSLCASVTNDSLTNLVLALALLFLIRFARYQDGERTAAFRCAAALGVLVGIGIWTKTSTLLLLPAIAVALYLPVRAKRLSAANAAATAGVAFGLGIVLGLPWLLRNQLLYGDPVAQHVFLNGFGGTAQAADIARYVFSGSLGDYLLGVARWTFASFWGVFDSMRLFWGQDPHGPTPSPAADLPTFYDGLALLCIIAAAGLIRIFVSKKPFSETQRTVFGAFVTLIAGTELAHLRFVLTFFQAQGRYLYPSLLPLAFFFALGWRGMVKNNAVYVGVAAALAVGMLALNLYALFGLLAPRFQP